MNSSDSPAFECASYSNMLPLWELINTVAGGTRTMRAAGEKYLPKEQGESQVKYERRLKRTVMFNAYRRTRDGLVGMVFSENPEIGTDTPDAIKEQLSNVDLAGTHLDVFAKEAFTDQFEGHVIILVDMPPALPEGSTQDDERRANRRPYWVKYRACQVPNWRTSTINGHEKLVQISFRESSYEPAGRFGEQPVTRYRVFSVINGLVQCEVFLEVVEENGAVRYVSDGITQTKLTEIPVAIAYGRRKGVLESEPTLYDLAELNVAHWQEYSDYRNILHVANVPILVRKGGDEDKNLEVGPGSLVDIPAGADTDLFYCEHQGAAIGAAKAELNDLEQRMASLGLSTVAPKPTTQVTATEKKLDHNESSSELATMARSMQDCLQQCMRLMGMYQNCEAGSIELPVNDDDLTLDAQTMTVLLNAADGGKLSVETFLTILKQNNVLPEEVTVKDELARIRSTDIVPMTGM